MSEFGKKNGFQFRKIRSESAKEGYNEQVIWKKDSGYLVDSTWVVSITWILLPVWSGCQFVKLFLLLFLKIKICQNESIKKTHILLTPLQYKQITIMMMTTIMTPTIASTIVIISVVWSPDFAGGGVVVVWRNILKPTFVTLPYQNLLCPALPLNLYVFRFLHYEGAELLMTKCQGYSSIRVNMN